MSARLLPRGTKPPPAPVLDLSTLVEVREQLQVLKKRVRGPKRVLVALEGMLDLAIATRRPEGEDHPPIRLLRAEAIGGRR